MPSASSDLRYDGAETNSVLSDPTELCLMLSSVISYQSIKATFLMTLTLAIEALSALLNHARVYVDTSLALSVPSFALMDLCVTAQHFPSPTCRSLGT